MAGHVRLANTSVCPGNRSPLEDREDHSESRPESVVFRSAGWVRHRDHAATLRLKSDLGDEEGVRLLDGDALACLRNREVGDAVRLDEVERPAAREDAVPDDRKAKWRR